MKKKHLILLALLTIVGFFLRTWQLESLPSTLNRDEAALAYNAYLIEKTNLDEFGKKMPLTFESFGDYKLPGYIYTLSLFFKILPANDFTVRLPSAIAGTLLIPIVFFFSKRLNLTNSTSLKLSLVIAVNPVFWFYSRIAFEANVALTLFTLALAFFFKNKPNFKNDLAGIIFTSIAILFYNTPLLLLPFFTISIIINRGIKNLHSWLALSISLAIIFAAFYFQLSELTAQKKGITWFNDETTWDQSVKFYNQYSGLEQKVLGNKFVFYGGKILTAVSKSLSPQFLVTKGGSHPWHSLPNWGHLYWPTYLLGIAGLLLLSKDSFTSTSKLSKLLLILTSLIPSAITVDSPHATRSLIFFVLFCWASVFALEKAKGRVGQLIFLSFISSQILFSLVYAYHYFSIFKIQQPKSLMSGYQKIINELSSTKPNEKIAVVDDSGYQYILTAWYLKMEPSYFFSTVIKQLPDKIGFKYGQQVGQFHFIAKASDRDVTEKVLLEWKDNLWQTQ